MTKAWPVMTSLLFCLLWTTKLMTEHFRMLQPQVTSILVEYQGRFDLLGLVGVSTGPANDLCKSYLVDEDVNLVHLLWDCPALQEHRLQ